MGKSVQRDIFCRLIDFFFIFQKRSPKWPKSFFFHRKVPLKIKIIYTFGPYFEKDPQKVRIRRIILVFFRIFKKDPLLAKKHIF